MEIDRKSAFAERHELESIADLLGDSGKGLLIGLAGALLLGKMTPDVWGLFVASCTFTVSVRLMVMSLKYTREAALLLYEEEKE